VHEILGIVLRTNVTGDSRTSLSRFHVMLTMHYELC